MRASRLHLLPLAVVLLVACSGTFVRTLDVEQGRIEVGMTGSEIMAVLGSPDSVRGYPNYRYAGRLGVDRAGPQTTEWVWDRAVSGRTLVVYLEDRLVVRIATIKRLF